MKKYGLLFLLCLIGCKQETASIQYQNTCPTPSPLSCPSCPVCPQPEPTDTILSNWVAVSQPTIVLQKINLSSYNLGPETNSQNAIPCNGTFGNNGQVRGINPNNLRILGSPTQGFIQFGHLKYVGESNADCSNASKEEYSYKVEPNKLTLCLTAYPFCTEFQHP